MKNELLKNKQITLLGKPFKASLKDIYDKDINKAFVVYFDKMDKEVYEKAEDNNGVEISSISDIYAIRFDSEECNVKAAEISKDMYAYLEIHSITFNAELMDKYLKEIKSNNSYDAYYISKKIDLKVVSDIILPDDVIYKGEPIILVYDKKQEFCKQINKRSKLVSKIKRLVKKETDVAILETVLGILKASKDKDDFETLEEIEAYDKYLEEFVKTYGNIILPKDFDGFNFGKGDFDGDCFSIVKLNPPKQDKPVEHIMTELVKSNFPEAVKSSSKNSVRLVRGKSND